MQKFLQLSARAQQYLEDDFIVTPSNKDAYDYLTSGRHWGELPFKNSLLLVGPKSSGKSFLAKIWQRRSGAALLPAGEFDQTMAGQCAYIIEDIENWQQKKLLAAFNVINEANKPLLLTGHALPFACDLQDLQSRINSLRVVSTAVDQDLLEVFIFRYFSHRGRQVSMKLIKFLAARLSRTLDKTLQTLNQINNKASALQKPISVELAREFLLEIL